MARGLIVCGMYEFATSTCTILDATTTQCIYVSSTSTPLYIQDAGNISYGIAWLIFLNMFIFLGLLWNSAKTR